MSFQRKHTLFFKNFRAEKRTEGESVTFTVNLSGEFPVLFPGPVTRGAKATFTHRFRVSSAGDEEQPGKKPLHGGVHTESKKIPLTLRIFTPDGKEFTGTRITLAELKKFRDRRGASLPWKYTVRGESERVFLGEDSSVANARGAVSLSLVETISSESAPPLVANELIPKTPRSFTFDLFRVGSFVAEIRSPLGRWRGVMRLIDPDGAEVARTTARRLTFEVGLPTLNKSRDTAGRVRKWTLEVSRQGAVLGTARVNATVIGRGQITIEAAQSRIDALLGEHGKFIEIFGEDKDEHALVRLRVKNVVSAETIDMHNLIEGTLRGVEQDEGVSLVNDGFEPDVVYSLARIPDKQAFGTKLKVAGFKVESIDVVIGPGSKLGASVPAIKVTVGVSGKVKIKKGPATIADVEVPGNQIAIEIGIKLSEDGTPQFVTSVPDTLFDGDVSPGAAAVLAATGVLGLLGAALIERNVDNTVEEDFNDPLVKTIRDTFADPTLAPRILMTIFGAHLTYQRIGIENGAIVFDYIAPLEPDPRPTPGYHGAIGRSFTQSAPNVITFDKSLGDTWSAENLRAKIDHIVVVMMENRSYDHVLGYRARPPFNDGARSLSEKLIGAFASAVDGPFKVRNMDRAGFARNSLQLMTRLPKGVGHEFADVKEQLSKQTTDPDGKKINSPRGFVDNFEPRTRLRPGETAHNVVPDDVLGFYDDKALPFFAYLAENYAYTDHYYCSHPGPTLPNRMYSLTGDLQHDRYGFPILDNNDGDNFLLSRAPTIYDLMIRRGKKFRVYESFPSVTMLRMFARYATDIENIVALGDKAANLKADVKRGRLPALTVVEPQMHAHPQDDDHPDADMHRGQIFLKNVYEALRSNTTVWERTLLIITYDEHGGLYDHIIPPIADVYTRSGGRIINPNVGASMPAATLVSASGASQPPPPPTPKRTGTGKFAFPAKISPKALSALVNAPQLMEVPLSIPYGVRVPTFVVSPWTKPGKGPDLTLDHCSILKTVLACFFDGKPFLSDRVSASNSFDAFLTESVPRVVPPFKTELDDLDEKERKRLAENSAIITRPLSRAAMRAGPVDYHDLTGRLARQLGR
jgi:phospholipase C